MSREDFISELVNFIPPLINEIMRAHRRSEAADGKKGFVVFSMRPAKNDLHISRAFCDIDTLSYPSAVISLCMLHFAEVFLYCDELPMIISLRES